MDIFCVTGGVAAAARMSGFVDETLEMDTRHGTHGDMFCGRAAHPAASGQDRSYCAKPELFNSRTNSPGIRLCRRKAAAPSRALLRPIRSFIKLPSVTE